MYVFTRSRRMEWAEVLHTAAAVAGGVLFASWAGFVAADALRPDFRLAPATYLQGATLLAVFCGYAVGWARPMLGGMISLVGTALFFAASLYDSTAVQAVAESPALLFAVPGVMYLLSAHYGAANKNETTDMT
ncbi:MAG: hypothetical protein JNL18_06750 [Planctomycetaceae bacterium]|nr:hypothetical protein [Planctomycetaceae bacterium]